MTVRFAFLSAAIGLLVGCDICKTESECLPAAASSDDAGETGAGAAPCHPQAGALYPSNGCGVTKGALIDDYTWTGRLTGISSPVTTLTLHDYYNPDGSKPTRFMFITVSAFWCQACKDEAKQLNGLYSTYGPRGVMVVTDIAQKIDKSPTDQNDVDVWIKTFNLKTAVVNDPDFVLQVFFDPSTMPLDLIIDLKTMEIVYKATGSALPSITSFLDSVTAG